MESEETSKPELELKKSQRPPTLGSQYLRTLINGALNGRGRIYSIPHCQKHMLERKFDMNDVIEILLNGDLEQYQPEWREDHKNWIYFAVGEDLEGQRLKIIFSLPDADYRIRLIGGERYHRGKKV